LIADLPKADGEKKYYRYEVKDDVIFLIILA